MSETILFARQPIFDNRQNVYGYELLFRDGDVDHARFIDGDLATRSVLLNAYAENSAPKLLNGKPGLLNVSRKMLASLPSFANEFLIIELLEGEHHVAALVDELKEIRKHGFSVALDDFDIQHYSPELIEQCDIIKLDVFMYSKPELAKVVDTLSQHSVRLLAEKVETHEMFQFCQSLGFDLYQGYFFCRPESVKGHVFDANRRAIFDLVSELYKPEVDVPALTEIVKRDVVLSYKLLKLVNSSFYRRAQEVESINHAVMMLGISRIRSWATLVSLGKLNNKPDELNSESLLRAYMCEYLGRLTNEETASKVFSIGLLSCLDAWFDHPIANLVEVLPLTEEFRMALTKHEGPGGKLLLLVMQYIHSEWSELTAERLSEVGLSQENMLEAYEYAVERTDAIASLVVQD